MSDVVTAALVATGGTLGGVALTGLFAHLGRQRTADDRQEDRRAAHDLWIRDRRAEAYLGLLTLMVQMSTYLTAHILIIDQDAEFDQLPPLPSVDEQSLAMGRLNMFGHPNILVLATEWDELMKREMRVAARLRTDRDDVNALQNLIDLRKDDARAHDAVGRAINEDLRTPPTF